MAEQNEHAVERVDPFAELDLFRGFGFPPLRRFLGHPRRESGEHFDWAPAVDINEAENEYNITAELPGAKKEDIHVECHDGVLIIKGEKRDEREEEDEHRHYVERRFGSFTRSFRLPENAADEEVRAVFSDGVLSVSVPKVEPRKPKSIAIK